MIYDATEKLKSYRDGAYNLNKLDESNTYAEILRLMYTCDTRSASSYAANIDKIIAYVKQGYYAHSTKDVKRLCNAAKRIQWTGVPIRFRVDADF